MISFVKKFITEVHSVMVKATWKEKLILISSYISMLVILVWFLFFAVKFLVEVVPVLLVIGLFIAILFSDRIEAYIKELNAEKERCRLQKQYQEDNFPYEFGNALFSFLTGSMAQVLGFQQPGTVQDITPTAYYVKQYLGSKVYCRFIAYRVAGASNISLSEIRRYMNQYFNQQLQAGAFNIEPLFYKDCPAIYVTRIAPDTNVPGYLAIDLMFIRDEASYEYAKSLEYQDRLRRRIKPPKAPLDRDF